MQLQLFTFSQLGMFSIWLVESRSISTKCWEYLHKGTCFLNFSGSYMNKVMEWFCFTIFENFTCLLNFKIIVTHSICAKYHHQSYSYLCIHNSWDISNYLNDLKQKVIFVLYSQFLSFLGNCSTNRNVEPLYCKKKTVKLNCLFEWN